MPPLAKILRFAQNDYASLKMIKACRARETHRSRVLETRHFPTRSIGVFHTPYTRCPIFSPGSANCRRNRFTCSSSGSRSRRNWIAPRHWLSKCANNPDAVEGDCQSTTNRSISRRSPRRRSPGQGEYEQKAPQQEPETGGQIKIQSQRRRRAGPEPGIVKEIFRQTKQQTPDHRAKQHFVTAAREPAGVTRSQPRPRAIADRPRPGR